MGGPGHHAEPAGAVALACRLQGLVRPIPERGDLTMPIALARRALPFIGIAALIGVVAMELRVAPSAAETARVAPAPVVDTPTTTGPQTAVLAGGCFWGIQGVFQ